MLDASDLPERPTPALTAAIREAAEKGDVATLRRLTRCDDDRLALWAGLAHMRLRDDDLPISARLTSRDWLVSQGPRLRHLVPAHLPAAATRAGFRLDGSGKVKMVAPSDELSADASPTS
jgi:hypothetical protein